MRNKIHRNEEQFHTLKRLFVVCLLLFIVITSIYSVVYVESHWKHTCTGSTCQICLMLQNAGMIKKNIAVLTGTVLFCTALVATSSLLADMELDLILIRTLVRDKVRMNH